MRRPPWSPPLVFAVMIVPAVLLLAPAAAIAKPTLTDIRSQLRDLFADWDLDGDGFLDKEELAKAFRGPKAKPFDYQAKGKETSQPKTKPNYSSYPDYQFLTLLDRDGDGKISEKEWQKWARDYASQLKAYLDVLDQVNKANVRYSAAKTTSSRRTALSKLQQLQRNLKALEQKQKAFEKKLLKAMKKSTKG